MNSKHKRNMENTSTPKRRRISLRRKSSKLKLFIQSSSRGDPIPEAGEEESDTVRDCESPRLPCNQVEYLSESGNTSCSEIPCSPGIMDNLALNNISNWDSLVSSVNSKNLSHIVQQEIENISDEMFCSLLENTNQNEGKIITKTYENRVNTNLDDVSNKSTKQFKPNSPILESKSLSFSKEIDHNLNKSNIDYENDIEQYFDEVNHTISNFDTEKKNRSSLFETKDSFLLDIKENSIFEEVNIKNLVDKNVNSKPNVDKFNCNRSNKEGYYGLPITAKGLFKTFRKIDKFYDWQEECLNLDAIEQRRNLIYALPTSGGKTLVAEVLMMREVINRKKNVLFILPYVAIVQEKIWALSPFAVQLDFLIEEYAGGKGCIPPKKRRKKNTIYIATIEKGLALVRSLIELQRLDELGLIVVDELHLIGEKGRGGTLETLLTTVIFVNQNIQIVGMSATIGNLNEVAMFLKAEVYERHFRPVQLLEYVKLGAMLYRMTSSEHGLELVPDRELEFNYSESVRRRDPDGVCVLAGEVARGGVLVFCATQGNCENVANMIADVNKPESDDRKAERLALIESLKSEGSSKVLLHTVGSGIAYHHAGLSSEERNLLEHAFRSGVITCICCTSTLAAGVNLPAARVIIRGCRQGAAPLTVAAYKQMSGRAGRTGLSDTGESIIICSPQEWSQLKSVLEAGLAPVSSALRPTLDSLLLSAVALQFAVTGTELRRLLDSTFMAVPKAAESEPIDTKSICIELLRSLTKTGVLEIKEKGNKKIVDLSDDELFDNVFVVSRLGDAAIKGCMSISDMGQLVSDLLTASRGLVLLGPLHVLYVVTPLDDVIRPDYRHFYSLYCELDDEGIQTAKALGISEVNAIRMMTGRPITSVSPLVVCRFYMALMLRDLWRQVPLHVVADKYVVGRGRVQWLLSASTSRACGAASACSSLRASAFASLLQPLAAQLRSCAHPQLHALMELPAVKKARAMQLLKAGYKRIEDIAKASPESLTSSITHLSRTAATHLISAARMMLIEKVENLRAEAEEVMEELNS